MQSLTSLLFFVQFLPFLTSAAPAKPTPTGPAPNDRPAGPTPGANQFALQCSISCSPNVPLTKKCLASGFGQCDFSGGFSTSPTAPAECQNGACKCVASAEWRVDMGLQGETLPGLGNAVAPNGEDCHVWNGRIDANPAFAEGKGKALPCN